MLDTTRANLLIADAGPSPWAQGLARALQTLPVDLHWTRTDRDTINIITTTGVHVAIVDDQLPGGGLRVLQRVRQLGWTKPCLFICDHADARMLRDALALDVYSVIAPIAERDVLTPMVLKVFKQVYQMNWADASAAN